MANRYLVGTGARNWNDAAIWSETSGGAGGASVPTANDNVFFDANSGTGTLTVNAAANMLTFDVTGMAANLTLANAAYQFNVHGSLKLSNYLLTSFTGTGYLYFKATTTVEIWANGTTKSWNRIYFDGVGGTWTNMDDWNAGTSIIYLTNGTWNTGNNNITTTGSFNTATGTKVLTLGSGIFKIAAFQNTTPTNFTFNPNTSTVEITTTSTLTGTNTFYNLTYTGASAISAAIVIATNITVSNTLTISGNNSSNYRLIVKSNIIATQRTITVNGTIVASNVDFRDITGAGTANWDLSAITGGSGDAGGNSGITFTPSQTQYFKDVTYLDKLNGNGNFENGLIGTIALGTGQAATWTLNTVNPISGTRDGLLSVTVAGSSSSRPALAHNLNYTTNKTYRWSFKYKVKSGSCRVNAIHNGTVNLIDVNQTLVGEGTFSFNILALGTMQPSIYFANLIGETQIDDFKVEEINSYGWSESTNWFSNIERTIAGRVPLPQDDPIFDNLSFAGTSLLSVNVSRIGRSLNMELVNQAVTFNLANNIECYGDFVLGNNITPSGDYRIDLTGRYQHIINTFQKKLYFIWTGVAGGNYKVQSNLVFTTYISARGGVLDFNNYNCTGGRPFDYDANFPKVYLRNGIFTGAENETTHVLYCGNGTLYAGNSSIIIRANSSSNLTFIGGNQSFNIVRFLGSSTGNMDITYSNTFAELIIDPGRKVRFEGGRTFSVGKLTNNGESGNLTTIGSTTTTKANIALQTVQNIDYANISYINVTQANKLFAGLNSVDGGNNTNVVFNAVAEVIPPFELPEAEVIETILLGNGYLPARLTEAELAGAVTGALAQCMAGFTEGCTAAATMQAIARVAALFTGGESMVTVLTALSRITAGLTDDEAAVFDYKALAAVTATFTEAAALYASLVARARVALAAAETETNAGDAVALATAVAQFTHSELLFMRDYEKITGISTFSLLIQGKSVFTWIIEGKSNFK